MKSSARRGSLARLLLVILLSGCSTSHYRKSADREAYAVIHRKSSFVQNADAHFTIQQTNVLFLDRFPIATNAHDFLGTDGERERGARVLRLEDALALAKFCKTIPSKVNLIEYNPIDDGEFQQASEKAITMYQRILEKHGTLSHIRKSRGKDIDAACGQLANKS